VVLTLVYIRAGWEHSEFNIIYIMRRHSRFESVAFLGVSTS
jgi:hypothetical protein